jgi:hypothetical protein
MNRRDFVRNVAGLATSAAASTRMLSAESGGLPDTTSPAKVAHEISVMLWTVFRQLPFDNAWRKSRLGDIETLSSWGSMQTGVTLILIAQTPNAKN